jgi:hypothetical protein
MLSRRSLLASALILRRDRPMCLSSKVFRRFNRAVASFVRIILIPSSSTRRNGTASFDDAIEVAVFVRKKSTDDGGYCSLALRSSSSASTVRSSPAGVHNT